MPKAKVPSIATEVKPATTTPVTTILTEEIGLTAEQAAFLIDNEGLTSTNQFSDVDEAMLARAGVKSIPAKEILRLLRNYGRSETSSSGNSANAGPDTTEVVSDSPNTAQITGFANQLGVDPNTMNMIMMGNMMGGSGGGMMDISSMVPIPTILAGYNPKVRNMCYMFLGQVETTLGGNPIIVINEDGRIDQGLTVQYITELQEGAEPADDDTYFSEDGVPHELIRVGVDAQSIYDVDPLGTGAILPQSQVGKGNIAWKNVPQEVRQVVFYAATTTSEVSPTDSTTVNVLRGLIKPGVSVRDLGSYMPKAIKTFYAARRDGTLPTLRASRTTPHSRAPRTMPNRRAHNPRDFKENPFRGERD